MHSEIVTLHPKVVTAAASLYTLEKARFVRKVYAAKYYSPSIYFVGHRVGEEYERH